MTNAQIWYQSAQQLRQGQDVHILRNLTDGNMCFHTLTDTNKTCELYQSEGKQWFYQHLCSKPKLILCGGGHVSFHVAQLGELLDFSVTVIDDRAEFASSERFPAARVICMDFEQALSQINGGENVFFVIATRGHAHDSACLASILRKPFAYVGMIGSRSKIAHVREQMIEKGIEEAQFAKVHTPIGLKIGAITPSEIAISIAAELVQVRASQGRSAFIGDDVVQCLLDKRAAAMVTILSQTGSSPRGPGAVMAVQTDGTICGTIGGGEAERQAANTALTLSAGTYQILSFDMRPQAAAQSGMVCGGQITLLLESLKEENPCTQFK